MIPFIYFSDETGSFLSLSHSDPEQTDYQLGSQNSQNRQKVSPRKGISNSRNQPSTSSNMRPLKPPVTSSSGKNTSKQRNTSRREHESSEEVIPERRMPANRTAVKSGTAKKLTGAAKRKQGAKAMSEIIRLQKTTECQIPRAPFARFVRQTMQRTDSQTQNLRITPQALEALRESAEGYVTNLFTDSYLITLNRKQVTLKPQDIQLFLFLKGPGKTGT